MLPKLYSILSRPIVTQFKIDESSNNIECRVLYNQETLCLYVKAGRRVVIAQFPKLDHKIIIQYP